MQEIKVTHCYKSVTLLFILNSIYKKTYARLMLFCAGVAILEFNLKNIFHLL